MLADHFYIIYILALTLYKLYDTIDLQTRKWGTKIDVKLDSVEEYV